MSESSAGNATITNKAAVSDGGFGAYGYTLFNESTSGTANAGNARIINEGSSSGGNGTFTCSPGIEGGEGGRVEIGADKVVALGVTIQSGARTFRFSVLAVVVRSGRGSFSRSSTTLPRLRSQAPSAIFPTAQPSPVTTTASKPITAAATETI